MKITFTTVNKDVAGNPLPPSELASLAYIAFVDTVNPPVAKYTVPQALIDAAPANPDGTKTVTVDASALSPALIPVPGTDYFVAMEDSAGNVFSPETGVISFTEPEPQPAQPGNLSVA